MQVGHADVHLAGQRSHQLHLGEKALANEDRAQPAAVLPLLGDAGVELVLAYGAGAHKQRADALAAQGGGLLPPEGAFHTRSQVDRVEGFGDHVGGAQAVALLEVKAACRAG